MTTIITCTPSQFYERASDIHAKILALDQLISAFELKMFESVENAHLSEIQMNDGQMIIRTNYRSMNEMTNALKGFIKLREMYVSKLRCRKTILKGGIF